MANLSRCADFARLLAAADGVAPGELSNPAARWDLADDMCPAGWTGSAIAREQVRTHLGHPWPSDDARRHLALRRRGLAILRQQEWAPDVTRMSSAERNDCLRQRPPAAPQLSLLTELRLLPRLKRASRLPATPACGAMDDFEYPPDEHAGSTDGNGSPIPTNVYFGVNGF